MTDARGVGSIAGRRRLDHPAIRLTLGAFGLLAYFFLLLFGGKLLFIGYNWSQLRGAGLASLLEAIWKGLRFDASALAFLVGPVLFLYWGLASSGWRGLRWILLVSTSALAFLLPIAYVADLQYFEESGNHLSNEVALYFGPSIWPVISGAFRLHPLLCCLTVLAAIGLAWGTWQGFNWLLHVCLPADGRRHPSYLVALLPWLLIAVVAVRGGVQKHPLKIGDSLISADPYLNALCLNPIYSVIRTMASPPGEQYRYFSEARNLQWTRDLLGLDAWPILSSRYPLLRPSPGTEKGNRRNVVLFVLESWSGKDVGALKGSRGITPVFDGLAHQGLLFTNFYAAGIRTVEGVASILCSFPNQPVMPVVKWSLHHQTHWRSLSQILADVGYRNIFIHGRDLDFDDMRQVLKSLHFHEIIDRRDFPPSTSRIGDSWPGYSDEEVMRRAHREFAAESEAGHPFFGVIYTMNTHPPFVVPKGYPRLLPPTDRSRRFLNALNYSDYTLKVFFDLARNHPYFKNTIFLLVADHGQTRDAFNYSNQHHIPFLIYAPGLIKPEENGFVAGQLDILPTVLGLLNLRALHASWGKDLLRIPGGNDGGFAASIAGNEVRWHTSRYLLVESPGGANPLLFDLLHDSDCTHNVWSRFPKVGKDLQTQLRAYMSLSQSLLYQDRIFPINPGDFDLKGSADPTRPKSPGRTSRFSKDRSKSAVSCKGDEG